MITKLSEFLAEKKKIQQIKENNEINTEKTSIDAAEKLKSAVDGIAKELGIDASTLEKEIENEVKNGTKTNEGFIDTVSTAITTFGEELYNLEHVSFSTGIIGLLIAAAVLTVAGIGGAMLANKKVKKALIAYINDKYDDEMKNIDVKDIKYFVISKVKELKSDKKLMSQLEKNPEFFIRKYDNK